MNPERWELVQALLLAVEALRPEERADYLDAACGGDAELRRDVEDLLASAEKAERYFAELAREVGLGTEAAAPQGEGAEAGAATAPEATGAESESAVARSLEGRRLGAYRLLRLVGRGGMGAVYLAERADGQFEKRVAVKLLPLGVDSPAARARFLLERQLLAGLEHPHIARLLDGGVAEDGTPYFVMEWVEGLPIDRYCDEGCLGVRERLGLFLQVCRAVQYAHQNLVVHRDLKPSNIVVGTDGGVKLLDFGIAKLLSAEAEFAATLTATGRRVLTPRFAAPEQLLGGSITTATDVYALGVLLYELLTGESPYRGKTEDRSWQALERAILEKEPTRPSVAVARVEPSREVAEHAGASADVAEARRTTRDALRRRLAGDLDNILLKALEKTPSHRYASVQQLVDDLERHLTGLPILVRPPGRVYRLRKFVARHRVGVAATLVVTLSLLSGFGASLWQANRTAQQRDAAERERAKAEKVTEFLVGLFEAADPLGTGSERTDTLRVRAVVDRGAERIRGELADEPGLQVELLATLGRVYANLGLYESGERVLREAVELEAEAGRAEAGLMALSMLARIAFEQNDFAGADSLHGSVLALYKARGAPADSLYIATLSERGLVRSYLGDYEAARELHERALRLAGELGPGDETLGPLRRRILANLGSLHFDLGEYEEAEPLLRRAVESVRASSRPDHPEVAAALNSLAATIHYGGRPEEAEAIYREAIAIARRSLGPFHSELANYLQNLATLYDDEARFAEAEALYREAKRIYEEAFGSNARTAMLVRNLALNRHAAGDFEEAERLLRDAHVVLAEELGAEHLYSVLTSNALGRVLTDMGRFDEAFLRISTALPLLEVQLPSGHYLVEASRRDLGVVLAARGEYEAAEPLLLASYQALLAGQGPDHYLTVQTREHLRTFYARQGRPDRAREYEPPGP